MAPYWSEVAATTTAAAASTATATPGSAGNNSNGLAAGSTRHQGVLEERDGLDSATASSSGRAGGTNAPDWRRINAKSHSSGGGGGAASSAGTDGLPHREPMPPVSNHMPVSIQSGVVVASFQLFAFPSRREKRKSTKRSGRCAKSMQSSTPWVASERAARTAAIPVSTAIASRRKLRRPRFTSRMHLFFR